MPRAGKKSSRKEGQDNQSQDGVQDGANTIHLFASEGAVDSHLAALFARSTGPIASPRKMRHDRPPQSQSEPELNHTKLNHKTHHDMIDEGQESEAPHIEADGDEVSASSSSLGINIDVTAETSSRKRKRREEHEELEDAYMRRIAQSESKEAEKRRPSKKAKSLERSDASHVADHEDSDSDYSENRSSTDEPGNDESDDGSDILQDLVPQHETQNISTKDIEIEKSSRTVFLANVSISAISSKRAKKTLLNHLTSFLPLPSADGSDNEAHKVESIRFRSTAFSSTSIPKKAAYAKKELMDATTKSTNAYVIYSTASAAREAAKHLNGTVVLERHLRVDSVAHPAKIDHRRCVFVGNLDFVDDESRLEAAAEEEGHKTKKTKKQPADVEEGLWRHFGEVGAVESVRVVRDPKTRVGKGFAYVQFVDPNSVEAALLYNDKKFPPLLPRKLRVSRAKRVKKSTPSSEPSRTGKSKHMGVEKPIYNPKESSNLQSLRGRAGKLLGRAGAAKLKREADSMPTRKNKTNVEPDVVFEGHRATKQSRPHGLKLGKSGAKKRKPGTRSSKRAAAWKAAKGKTITK